LVASSAKHDVFQAIADPTRRMMLKLLADREMPIAAITECFPISRTAVNKHLHVLSEAGLVIRRKVGRETRYKLRSEPLVELKDWLEFFEQYWDEKLFALKKYVEADND
jgi:DNA-binding transcriptional ArsR family regulator